MLVKACLLWLCVLIATVISIPMKEYSSIDKFGNVEDLNEVERSGDDYVRLGMRRPQRDRFMTLRLRQPYELFRPSGYRIY
uniref:FMRF-Like Peptide n=1 Tax=Steinernema glaseri TaxID=37863 RepID=A0A1I7YIY6_9BILA